MTPEQINLIQQNFKQIAPQSEDFATHFYNKLFALNPTLQLLFSTDLSGQKKKLMMTLGVAVKSLREPQKLTPILEDLGRRHALYGVRDEHYETVGAALVQTLSDTLGDIFTPAAAGAWTQMYVSIAETMKRGALLLKKDENSETADETIGLSKRLNLAGQVASLILLFFCFSFGVPGQTTDFTYQGKLVDNAVAANGTYQMKFSLFDAQGSQIGQTIENQTVAVSSGVFTVQLNFGTNAFRGEERFLEISVRRNAQENYVALTPRQRVTSAPYAMKSLNSDISQTSVNSAQLGGIEAEQYVQTIDSRLSDERNPKAGSANYIQNTTAPQTAANFNISGEGKANVLSAATQFNIGANRVLSTFGDNNLFVGTGAGAVNTGGGNTFVGTQAGLNNTTGFANSYFGSGAGANNTTGSENVFSGLTSGFNNTTGSSNAFYGKDSGFSNTTGSSNSFFGRAAGGGNTTGANNSFFGRSAGEKNTTGNDNTFVGLKAGWNNSIGSYNSFFGSGSGQKNTGDANSFFGSAAGSENTNGNSNAFFGTDAGRQNTTASNNSFFGTAAGRENTTGFSNSFFGALAGLQNTTGDSNSFFGTSAGVVNTIGKGNAFFGNNAGFSNLSGNYNSFFGNESGKANQTGNVNSFFGSAAGRSNTTGLNNSFFGGDAGRLNENGQDNSFFGTFSGFNNQSGTLNTFVGISAGGTNTIGSNNTMLGANANVGTGNLSFATAIGANATVSTSNTIALGRGDGSDKVRIFGLGANGTTQLCRNANNEISTCSLPLTKTEAVQTTEIIETLKTQKAQIAEQAEQIKKQQEQIEQLKQIVCAQTANQAICRK